MTAAKCYDFANGYVACLHETDPEKIPGTIVSAEDSYFTFAECSNGPWNLVRIQKDKKTNDKTYGFNPHVKPTTVYVVDSYVDIKHPEFEGRASLGFRNVAGFKNAHGTHVASTIAGYQYGVAKNAKIVSVQVLDDEGRGQWSGLLQGLSYISNKEAQNTKTVIVNMSIGGGYSKVINKAVDLLVKQGIIVVVAAGNSATNACQTSPAGSENAITVASSNKYDSFSSFSNYGSCVDIIGPGEGIRAAIPNNNYGVMSGTSMAAPHVSGVLANYIGSLKQMQTSPYCASLYLNSISTKSSITGALRDTPNNFLYAHDSQFCRQSLLEKWMNFPSPPYGLFE